WSLLMRWQLGWFVLVLLSSPVLAQQTPPASPAPPAPVVVPADTAGSFPGLAAPSPWDDRAGPLTSNRNFSNFIGFMSNPLQNIARGALSQIWPMFGSVWTSASPPLPGGNFQVLGPGLNVALSERLSIGLNQGGYAWAQFDRRDPDGILRDLQQA